MARKIQYTIKAEFDGSHDKNQFLDDIPESGEYAVAAIEDTEEVILLFESKEQRDQFLSALVATRAPANYNCKLYQGTFSTFDKKD